MLVAVSWTKPALWVLLRSFLLEGRKLSSLKIAVYNDDYFNWLKTVCFVTLFPLRKFWDLFWLSTLVTLIVSGYQCLVSIHILFSMFFTTCEKLNHFFSHQFSSFMSLPAIKLVMARILFNNSGYLEYPRPYGSLWWCNLCAKNWHFLFIAIHLIIEVWRIDEVLAGHAYFGKTAMKIGKDHVINKV